MDENEHPRGALLFILVYLFLLAALWTNAYLRLWKGWGAMTPERRPATTIYLYELAWILPSIAIPVGMLVALTVTAFGAGIHLPGVAGRIDPQAVARDAALQRARRDPGRARDATRCA